MTEKQRLKHERDNANRPATIRHLDMADIIEPKTPPRLSWVNAKTQARFTDRKHNPGRKAEHADALYEYQFANVTKIEVVDGQPTIVPDPETSAKIDQLAEGLNASTTGPDLQDHQREVPDVAPGTP